MTTTLPTNQPTDQHTDVPRALQRTLDRIAEALDAMGAGDPVPYAALWAHDPDVTLFGAWGPIEHGHDAVTTTFRWVAGRFSDGSLVPRYDVVRVSGDLAYTVGFERGEVRVDESEPFAMTIRVTHVLSCADGDWRLVHRHADFPPADRRRP